MWSGRGCLTSAACYCGIKTGAFSDVELDELLGAGGVNPDRVPEVFIGKPTPADKNTQTLYSFVRSCCYSQIWIYTQMQVQRNRHLGDNRTNQCNLIPVQQHEQVKRRTCGTYWKPTEKPWVTSPAFGPVKCIPSTRWSPSRRQTTWGGENMDAVISW